MLGKLEIDLINKWYSYCKSIGEEASECGDRCEFKYLCDRTINKVNRRVKRFFKEEKDMMVLWLLSCEDVHTPSNICLTEKCLNSKLCKALRIKYWKRIELP